MKYNTSRTSLIIITTIFFIACTNKKSFDVDGHKFVTPVIQTDIKPTEIKVAKKFIPNEWHVFLRNVKLPPYRVDTTPQRILLIGDSMSKWLRYRLQDYCEKNGHSLSTVTWVSGNTEWFAQYDTLNYYINKDSISYVFMVLGANELFIRDFEKNRGAYVDKILERLNAVKWIWVGPPNWKNDKGINDCLLSKLGKEKFFLSKNLDFKRQKDGMHPTVASCSMWVDSIVNWISKGSTSRIKLNIPDSSYHRKPDAVVLKPLE